MHLRLDPSMHLIREERTQQQYPTSSHSTRDLWSLAEIYIQIGTVKTVLPLVDRRV
jgi:hypothetical protein